MLDRIEQQISKLQLAEQENRQLTLSLEQKIAERTDALKTSNQELLNTLATLHQYQNQIVETEKMASLGQMVAGVDRPRSRRALGAPAAACPDRGRQRP